MDIVPSTVYHHHTLSTELIFDQDLKGLVRDTNNPLAVDPCPMLHTNMQVPQKVDNTSSNATSTLKVRSWPGEVPDFDITVSKTATDLSPSLPLKPELTTFLVPIQLVPILPTECTLESPATRAACMEKSHHPFKRHIHMLPAGKPGVLATLNAPSTSGPNLHAVPTPSHLDDLLGITPNSKPVRESDIVFIPEGTTLNLPPSISIYTPFPETLLTDL